MARHVGVFRVSLWHDVAMQAVRRWWWQGLSPGAISRRAR